jgi:hypothetical protein
VNAALLRLFDKYKSREPPTPTSRDLYAELKSADPTDNMKEISGAR